MVAPDPLELGADLAVGFRGGASSFGRLPASDFNLFVVQLKAEP